MLLLEVKKEVSVEIKEPVSSREDIKVEAVEKVEGFVTELVMSVLKVAVDER